MAEHPLDGEMRLAGVGRPQHGGNAGAGRPFIAERGVRRGEGHICGIIYVLADSSSSRGAKRRSNPHFVSLRVDGSAGVRNDGDFGNSLIHWDSLAPFGAYLSHFATPRAAAFKPANESGTKGARIADSSRLR